MIILTMCIHFPLHTIERSIFKNKISFSLNCSNEADETLSPLFLLQIKSYVSDCCHYLSWFRSSLKETFFLQSNVRSVPSGSLSLHAVCHVYRYSGSCGWVLHQQNLVARSIDSPVMPGSKVTVQWIGLEEKEPTVLSAGYGHWKFFGASLQFCFHSQSTSSIDFSVTLIYFFSLFYHWENKSLALVPDSSSVATALGGLRFSACCDFLEES